MSGVVCGDVLVLHDGGNGSGIVVDESGGDVDDAYDGVHDGERKSATAGP